jgi:hypothetical protein
VISTRQHTPFVVAEACSSIRRLVEFDSPQPTAFNQLVLQSSDPGAGHPQQIGQLIDGEQRMPADEV